MNMPKYSVQGVLAILITIGFFGSLFLVLLHGVEAANTGALLLLGSVATVFSGTYGFYFGSSLGSAAKEQTIQNLTKPQTPGAAP